METAGIEERYIINYRLIEPYFVGECRFSSSDQLRTMFRRRGTASSMQVFPEAVGLSMLLIAWLACRFFNLESEEYREAISRRQLRSSRVHNPSIFW